MRTNIISVGLISWIVASLFYLYEMILRIGMSVMTEDLRMTFSLASTQIGFLASAYYYSYVPMQLPCGVILDMIGVRKLLTFSCLLCTIGAYFFAESQSAMTAAFSRFLIGAGSAGAFIACLKLISGWFSITAFSLMTGLTNLMGCLGSIFAGRPLALALQSYGWRNTMLYLSLVGIGMTLMCWFFIKDPIKKTDASQAQWPFKESLKAVFFKKEIWIAGFVGGLMYLPITAFAEVWGIPFLKATYQITEEKASLATTALFIGMGIGGPIAGKIADMFLGSRKLMLFSSMTMSVLFLIVSYASFFPFGMIVFFLGLIGLFMGSQVLSFTLSNTYSPEKTSGTAAALTNAIIMLLALIMQPLLGIILDFFWDHSLTSTGIRLYTAQTYQYTILILPLCFVVSVFMLLGIKDKKEN